MAPIARPLSGHALPDRLDAGEVAAAAGDQRQSAGPTVSAPCVLFVASRRKDNSLEDWIGAPEELQGTTRMGRAAHDRDIAIAGRRACLCQCRLDSVGDEVVRGAAVHRLRLARVVSEHEDRGVVRRIPVMFFVTVTYNPVTAHDLAGSRREPGTSLVDCWSHASGFADAVESGPRPGTIGHSPSAERESLQYGDRTGVVLDAVVVVGHYADRSPFRFEPVGLENPRSGVDVGVRHMASSWPRQDFCLCDGHGCTC
jgi:hypothetical protein